MTAAVKSQKKGFRPGQAVVLATIALVVLLGSVAVVLDIGFMWNRKRQMQTAADAAAVAAANALYNADNSCGAATVSDAVTSIATANGFTAGTTGDTVTTVTPSCPPADGAYAGAAGFVEVQIQQSVPTYFLKVLGITSINVAARAVASTKSSLDCMVILNSSVSNALEVSGTTGTTLTTDCSIMVDSNSSSALTVGGGASITANAPAQIGVVGTSPGYSGNITPTPKTGIAPAEDPLSFLQPPAPCSAAGGCSGAVCSAVNSGCSIAGNVGNVSAAGCNNAVVNAAKTTATLSPGVYCAGSCTTSKGVSTCTAPAMSITTSGVVVLNPGTYILVGGNNSNSGTKSSLYVAAQSTLLNTGGVTFYNTGSPPSRAFEPVFVAGGATVTLTAPTSDPFTGVLFFQDRSVPHDQFIDSISGGSNSVFTGTMYFPTTELDVGGSGGNAAYTIFVSDILHLSGGSNFTIHADYSSLTNGSPLKMSLLYE